MGYDILEAETPAVSPHRASKVAKESKMWTVLLANSHC